MKKKLVKILGISYSQSQMGSYVVVLSEVKGKTKLPLIIKPSDAQQIALKIEGIKPQRPLTHDIFKSMTDSFGIDVQEIYIHSVLEGIFYTKIIASNGLDEVEIECVAGDGISLSLVYDCPIYVSQSVLDNAGISINNDGSSFDMGEEDIDIEEEPKRVVSIEDLEKMMEGALANEEYEIAAELRDRIQTLKDEIK
jgi:bifunctional DNase/RNase